MTVDPVKFFAALSHELRLRALVLLRQQGELCVCELMHALGVSQPMISRHLAQLREAGVAQDRREGQWIYYQLHPQLPQWASDALAAAIEGVTGREPFSSDQAVLSAMSNRPGASRCV